MSEFDIRAAIAIYLAVAIATVIGLMVVWAESKEHEKPIWPMAGIFWPILGLIGLWHAWRGGK
jgi:hypothetical protein